MKSNVTLSTGYNVALSLHPHNTYTICKVINGVRQITLIQGVKSSDLNATMTAILDNEQPLPNVSYLIEQE